MCGEVYSQTEISGKVTDGTNPLPGASLIIKGTTNSTSSDADGLFKLGQLNSGEYLLQVNYIGLVSQEITVIVKSESKINLGNITLKESKSEGLKEVVITSAYRPSQAKALSMKRASALISEVIASDAIGKLPDRNAAEAVQRIQGVSIERDMGEGRFVSVRGTPIQWSASTLNGNRMPSASGDFQNRGVQMDIFPSELIQFVKLSKAIAPDMDGDAIGGSVDFITKSAPLKEVLTVNAAAGYVDQSQAATYNASVLYGNKITDKLSFITSAVIWDRSSASDMEKLIYNFNSPDPVKSFAINELQLRDYVAKRRTLGFNAGLNYQFNENNKIYFKGLYSQYLDQQTVRENYFTFNANNAKIQSRHADYLTDLYSFQLGGDSKLTDKLLLNWSLSTAKSSFKFDSPDNLDKDNRGYPIVNFIQKMTYGGLSSDGLKYMQMDSPDGIGDMGDVVKPYVQTPINADVMHLNQVILSQNNNSEKDYRAQLDLKYNLNGGDFLKFGTKLSKKDKEVMTKTLVWMPGSLLGISGAPNTYLSDLETEKYPYNGGFLTELNEPYNDVLINQLTNGQIDQMYTPEFQKAQGLVQVQSPTASSNITGSYTGKENVYANYVMGQFNLTDKITFMGGIRNEYNNITFSGKEVVTTSTGNEIKPNIQDNSYNAFLPMAHLKYNFTDNTILRAAYTRTFARADFSDLNPSLVVNEITRTITQGNTDLKPTFSNNFDLMFEHYLKDVGIFSAGLFYKDLTNVIYSNQSMVDLNGQSYIKTNPDNLESASLFGFETGISKRFTELPGFLSHLGFEGNYTYIQSEVEIPFFQNGVQTQMIKTTLPKQAKHIFNTVLFYESNKFMARIAGNYKGKYLNEIRSSAGPDHYSWFDSNFTVDFTSSYAISKKIRLFLELNNITNSPNRFYMGNKDRIETTSYASFRGQVGVTYNIL